MERTRNSVNKIDTFDSDHNPVRIEDNQRMFLGNSTRA